MNNVNSKWVKSPGGVFWPAPGWIVGPDGEWVPPTVRPLQGIDNRSRGSSLPLRLGDTNKTLVTANSRGTDAEILAVQTGLTVNNANGAAAGNNSLDVFGRVTWGVGGANYSADFDFLQGTTFSVVANYLKVDANYLGSSLVPGAPTLEFQANASVGYGTAPRQSVVQRTIDLGTIAKNSFVQVLAPEFAKSFTILVGTALQVFPPFVPTAAPQLFIELANLGVGTSAFYEYTNFTNTAKQEPTTFPIPNTGQFGLLVFNNDAANDIDAVVIFDLSL